MVMTQLVMEIPISRSCGVSVPSSQLASHEEACGKCAGRTQKELKLMVNKLVRRVMTLNKNLKTAQRNEKRARDESDKNRERVKRYSKKLHDREMRANRRLMRAKRKLRRETCLCGDCVAWKNA
jgi:hypothetical protein